MSMMVSLVLADTRRSAGPTRPIMAQRLFNAFDRSGDGKVSLDELEGGLLLLRRILPQRRLLPRRRLLLLRRPLRYRRLLPRRRPLYC